MNSTNRACFDSGYFLSPLDDLQIPLAEAVKYLGVVPRDEERVTTMCASVVYPSRPKLSKVFRLDSVFRSCYRSLDMENLAAAQMSELR